MISSVTANSPALSQEREKEAREVSLLLEKFKEMTSQLQNASSFRLDNEITQVIDDKISELQQLILHIADSALNSGQSIGADVDLKQQIALHSDSSENLDFVEAQKSLEFYINSQNSQIGISFESFSLTSQEHFMLAKNLLIKSPLLFFCNLSAFQLTSEDRFVLAKHVIEQNLFANISERIKVFQSLSLTPSQFLKLVEINPPQLACYMQEFRISREDAFMALKKSPRELFPYLSYAFTQEQCMQIVDLLLEQAPELLLRYEEKRISYYNTEVKIFLDKELCSRKEQAHLFINKWIEKKARERQETLFNESNHWSHAYDPH